MKKFAAGIVSYNPDISRLKENIETIRKQVKIVLIIDNASDNVVDIRQMIKEYKNVYMICNTVNKGIAVALNQICHYLKEQGMVWCLLLDQDSICSENLIEIFSKYIDDKKVGMLCPYIVDEFKITLSKYKQMTLSEKTICDYAITSGSFIKLDIWEKIGGFFEDLFVDGVDADYSYNLRMHGYVIYRVNKGYIMHQQGNNTEKTHIYRIHRDETGRKTIKPAFRFNYSMMRWYYMARNNWILIKKYRKLNGLAKPLFNYIIRFLSVILIERHKMKVIASIFNGFIDGVKYKVETVKF